MTTKLNQIIAVEKGIKSKSYADITEMHKINQKPELFSGFDKKYQPKDDQDESLPPESKRVQFTTDYVLKSLERTASELMNITARKDWTNMVSKADIKVDGKTILASVPITYLLFLEKQLTDYHTFAKNLPVLDHAEDWKKDVNSGLYKTEPVSTHRTKKVVRPLVLYPATPEHPAQTQLISEDVIAGFWNLVKFSGAISKPAKEELIQRVEILLRSVKEAREEANAIDEVTSPDVGSVIFEYLLPTTKEAKKE
jgi:hypothetical protein